MKPLLAFLLLALLPSCATALSLIPVTDSMRIEQAERIVIGTISFEGDESLITVQKVLKGPAKPSLIRSRLKPRGQATSQVIFTQGAPNSRTTQLIYIEESSPVWALYHMLIDPAPACDPSRYPENADIIGTLGYLFDPIQISSPDAPEVAWRLSLPYHKSSFPWAFQGSLEVKCRPDPERRSRVEILSMNPDTAQTREFRWPLITQSIEEHKPSPPGTFTLNISTLPPERRGSLTWSAATAYLRDRLGSADPAIQMAAISALARLRDLDSVPAVIGLIDAENEELTRVALNFLKEARDPRAVAPLCQLLATHAPNYPQQHQLSDGASQALGQIGDEEAIPYLESAATHGVQRAIGALPSCGRAESIAAILSAVGDESLSNSAGVSLFWLVRRSNKTPQPWMDFSEMKGGQMQAATAEKWRSWWQANQHDLKLVRSFEGALIAWHPTYSKPPVRIFPRHFRRYWPHYLLALLFAAAVVLGLRKARRSAAA